MGGNLVGKRAGTTSGGSKGEGVETSGVTRGKGRSAGGVRNVAGGKTHPRQQITDF